MKIHESTNSRPAAEACRKHRDTAASRGESTFGPAKTGFNQVGIPTGVSNQTATPDLSTSGGCGCQASQALSGVIIFLPLSFLAPVFWVPVFLPFFRRSLFPGGRFCFFHCRLLLRRGMRLLRRLRPLVLHQFITADQLRHRTAAFFIHNDRKAAYFTTQNVTRLHF